MTTSSLDVVPSLIELAERLGERIATAANQPLRLDDPSAVWIVSHGAVDVFLFAQRGDEITSSAQHMLRAEPGRLLFGVAPDASALVAIGKGLPDTEVARVSLASLAEAISADSLGAQVDAWIGDLGRAVAARIDPRPRPTQLVDPATSFEQVGAQAGDVLSARGHGVVWIALTNGDPGWLGTENPIADGTGLLPITLDSWLTVGQAATGRALTSAQLAESGTLSQALGEFHQLALSAERLNRTLLIADVVNEQVARAEFRRRDVDVARDELSRVLERRRVDSSDDSLLMAALSVIGRHEGISFRAPPPSTGPSGEEPSLREVLQASGVRTRRVRLRSEDRWWLGDSGAMLAFRREDASPVALLPHWGGRYRLIDPSSATSQRIDAVRAAELAEDAWLCYPRLPSDRVAGATDLARLAGNGMLRDFARFAAIGLVVALLTQAPAIGIGALADWVLASQAGGMLVQIMIALLAFGAIGVLLEVLQGTAMMRIEGRAAARVNAAIWDRLLSLRPRFFRQFTAGELATRMSTMQVLRDQISGVVANALFSFVFLLPTLAILFAYDVTLALVSVAIALITLTVTSIIGLLQLPRQRRWFAAERRLTSELLQFINGIGKLRGVGAEPSAFAAWARSYREQHLASIHIARLNEHVIAFSAALPALVGAALFAVALSRGDGLEISDFLVVYAISMTFYAAVVNLGLSFEAVASISPAYEQVTPVLREVPEPRGHSGAERVTLTGELRFDHVSFHYQEDKPLIDDVSIHARPGEFIAIVGPSGSGKSTLMRLALGLEEPSSGRIYYDGRDLAALNRHELRRQLGVVTQDGSLQTGNLLDNIIGMNSELTLEDAWRAARLADVERDIREMPMQMFTVVSDQSTTFSGGQTQRIRIAAALARNPRILFLDEATSWLDARSQAEVMRGIEGLAATRFVIAHRLSTIRRADRIYVIESGRVSQQGTFDELYAVEGPFRHLVERQIV